MATIILFCAYRVNSAVRQIGVCRADDRKIPSPGGKGDREAVDEERRQVQEHMRTRGQTEFQNGAILHTAPVIGRFRHSSSVTKIGSEAPILATASPRGKPRALPRQCDIHQFVGLLSNPISTKYNNCGQKQDNIFKKAGLRHIIVNCQLSIVNSAKPFKHKFAGQLGGTCWHGVFCPKGRFGLLFPGNPGTMECDSGC